jgi:hypothetical protein
MPVRDWGLLEAALARPKATAFGQDTYPDVHSKPPGKPDEIRQICRNTRGRPDELCEACRSAVA